MNINDTKQIINVCCSHKHIISNLMSVHSMKVNYLTTIVTII